MYVHLVQLDSHAELLMYKYDETIREIKLQIQAKELELYKIIKTKKK